MSDIENAINDLVEQQVDSRIDDALANNYDFQDLMSRVETLEDSYQPFQDEDILLRLARIIVKDNSDNRVITYQSTIDNLKAEVDELNKKLKEKEEI